MIMPVFGNVVGPKHDGCHGDHVLKPALATGGPTARGGCAASSGRSRLAPSAKSELIQLWGIWGMQLVRQAAT
ncbi:hypothetical protein GCM10010517_77300 [Streptosporangium fragile]|uniref:Uncharacterized protein n=1 Tax=Streptosporangium fragile TaxID=46186 RepID=A0ABN3WE47_9ACTN